MSSAFRTFTIVMAALASAASLASLTPAAGTPSAGPRVGPPVPLGAGWQSLAGARPVPLLTAVSAISPADVWSVGFDGIRPLIEHWDGSTWASVASPHPGGVNGTYLYGVSATSASDAWAVGGYRLSSGTTKTLILHWDGIRWSTSPHPNPSPTHQLLFGVSADSAGAAWAVGYYERDGLQRSLVEHWDGTGWSRVASPSPGHADGTYLLAVSATSPGEVEAVGYRGGARPETLAEHLSGSRWTLMQTPNPGPLGNELYGVSALSSTDAWAVGFSFGAYHPYRTLVEHLVGSSWSVVPSPNHQTHSSLLEGVSAVSSNDVWAVGWFLHGRDRVRTLIEHWDGGQWTKVPSPNASDSPKNQLPAVSADSSSDAWAVGWSGKRAHTALREHWDGTSWTLG